VDILLVVRNQQVLDLEQRVRFRDPEEERFRLKFGGIDIQLLGEQWIEDVKLSRIYYNITVLTVLCEQSDNSIVDTFSRKNSEQR
jgi:hypothetical protein